MAHTVEQMKAKARAGGSSFGSVYLHKKSKKYLAKVQNKWASITGSGDASGAAKKSSKSRGNCSKKHLTMPPKKKTPTPVSLPQKRPAPSPASTLAKKKPH